MGRTYAGILGFISFGAVVARNLIDQGNVGTALTRASLALFAFALIGYVVGSIAERTIVETIEGQFRAHWKSEESADAASAMGDGTSSTSGESA